MSGISVIDAGSLWLQDHKKRPDAEIEYESALVGFHSTSRLSPD